MEKNKKIIIAAVVLVIIVVGIILVVRREDNNVEQPESNVMVLENGAKINISRNINKDRMIEGLKITNVQLNYNEGKTTLIADVENTLEEESELKGIVAEMLDEKGHVIGEAKGIIAKIEAKGKTKLNMEILGDCSNAYDLSIICK